MSSSSSPAPSGRGTASVREPMLDLWRGLALIDMAWVHLANHPIGLPAAMAMWIGEATRFAAGCLVLLSGLTVGHVFAPALQAGDERARAARHRLRRRALLLAAMGPLASAAYLALDLAMRGFPGGPSRLLSESASLAGFASPGVTGGLLLLYALLLVAVPGIEKFRARWGAATTMLASAATFAAAQWVEPAAHWPPWVFPLPHWQPLFVAGYLAAPRIGLLREYQDEAVRRWRLAVTVAVIALFAVRSSPALGLGASPLSFVEFRKVPLSTGELLWYAAASAAVLAWSAWLYDHSATLRRASTGILRIGRWSLLVYVAHLLLEPPILMLADATNASPAARTMALLGIAAAMGAVAWAADAVDAWTAGARRRPGRLRRLVPTSGMVGSGVAAVAMATVLVLRGVVVPVADPDPNGDARVTSPDADGYVDVLGFMDESEESGESAGRTNEGITWMELELEPRADARDPSPPSFDDLAVEPNDLAAEPEEMPLEP